MDINNIEEDKTKQFIKAYEEAKAQSFIIESINKDFFFEFADCLIARIKKLEEENETFKNFTSAIFNNNIEKEFIPARKVKNLIKNETINISGFEYIALEDLEELLEEK